MVREPMRTDLKEDRIVIIDAESDPRAWTVYHAQERRTLHNVLWVDTETATWCAHTGLSYWGVKATQTHQADKIEVDVQELRITINPGKWPEYPAEIHNPRKVSADVAMEAVRAMSKGA
jgi:hypothetical protein